jgi:hypothetical protein
VSWKKLLESVSASLNDQLQFRNDYLMAENRILRHQMNGRVQFTDRERQDLLRIVPSWVSRLCKTSPRLPSRGRFLPGTASSLTGRPPSLSLSNV